MIEKREIPTNEQPVEVEELKKIDWSQISIEDWELIERNGVKQVIEKVVGDGPDDGEGI